MQKDITCKAGKSKKGIIISDTMMLFAKVLVAAIVIALIFYGVSGALAEVHKSLKPVLTILASAMAVIKG
ncbi:MAG: hypothetical protein U9Q92_02600 [archaeon]|nr:hypothetical protein [archaeon]